jgi:hypothetical protein
LPSVTPAKHFHYFIAALLTKKFVQGALLAIRHVEKTGGVSVGLDAFLGIK